MKKKGHWWRWWAALFGREAEAPEDEAGHRARIAELEMDLRERDDRITAMQAEYAQLEISKGKAKETAGQNELEGLFKRLAGPLSNLATLVELARKGQTAEAADFVQLFDTLERELARKGLERVGATGDAADFDIALHQRMSGSTVRTGTPVVVQMPGYRMGAKVLLKAMVTTADSAATAKEEIVNGESGR
ncbi:MAG: nucleotide exchange factor GrpE [Candidatus Hydrogenedens sp.]|jgi:molecular chaperone GrpE (heat shock protein)|nr:nucleotide exchange factor GrpE [Candidatus Hydrogenedens sp.]